MTRAAASSWRFPTDGHQRGLRDAACDGGSVLRGHGYEGRDRHVAGAGPAQQAHPDTAVTVQGPACSTVWVTRLT